MYRKYVSVCLTNKISYSNAYLIFQLNTLNWNFEFAVVIHNDVNLTQNVFGHKTEHCESCQSPAKLPSKQTSCTDTTDGIPVQETEQIKSSSARCIRPVQPRSDDTGRSMEQASMPRQETTDHVTPKTYATPQTTVLPQATIQTKLWTIFDLPKELQIKKGFWRCFEDKFFYSVWTYFVIPHENRLDRMFRMRVITYAYMQKYWTLFKDYSWYTLSGAECVT